MKKLISLMAACFTATVFADAVLSADGSKVTIDVPVDASTSLSGPLAVAEGGEVEKTGLGTLTLPQAKIVQPYSARIKVSEGSVILQGGGEAEMEFQGEAVSNILAKAASWFDSSLETSLIMKPGSDSEVSEWLDVRENGSAASGYEFVRSVADTTLAEIYPVVRTDSGYGKRGMYFHGYRSGCWMNLVKPDGGGTHHLAYNVFVVHGAVSDLWGCVLGARASGLNGAYLAFVPGSSNGYRQPIWFAYSADCPAIYNARTYLNGEFVDAFHSKSAGIPLGFTLLEVELRDKPGWVSCFFNDRDFAENFGGAGAPPAPFQNRGGIRQGGDYISEVVIFTNRLTGAERLMVEGYLREKWIGTSKGRADIDIAGDASAVMKGGVDAVLSGCGSVTVEADGADCGGLFKFAEFFGSWSLVGSVQLRSSAALAVAAGMVYKVEDGIDTLPSYSSSTAASADEVVKEGSGRLEVKNMPDAVKRIRVKEGTLSLSSGRGHGCGETAQTEVFAQIPNPSFEEGIGEVASGKKDISNGGEYKGWHHHCASGISGSSVFVFDGEVFNKTVNYWALPDKVADGTAALGIKQDSSAWTKVTIPEDGVWELSFYGTCRMGAGYVDLPLTLAIGSSSDTLKEFGLFQISNWDGVFNRYRYFTPYLKAGTYELWFKSHNLGNDDCSLVDDLKLRLFYGAKARKDGTWKIPNGDFETLTAASFPQPTVNSAENIDALWGWSAEQPGTQVDGKYSVVAPITPDMSPDGSLQYSGRLYNLREGGDGRVQMHLCKGGSASISFVPPEGTWHLKADASMMPFTGKSGTELNFRAKVMSDGSPETDLGSVYHGGTTKMLEDVFPKAFTADGKTAFTLRLYVELAVDNANKDCHLNVDNLELVSAASGAVELAVNGGFETLDGWSVESHSTDPFAKSRLEDYNSATFADSFGPDKGSGKTGLRVIENGIVSRPVEFPLSGRYRLKVSARTRLMGGAYNVKGLNPISLWYAAGENKKIIGTIPAEALHTKFVEHVFNFEVDAPGAYTLGIEGLADVGSDRSTFVDDLQLRYSPYAEAAPKFSDEIGIGVEEGARMELDFPGTKKVRSLMLGGKKVSGTVGADDWPAYLSGPGKISVEPSPCFKIIVR